MTRKRSHKTRLDRIHETYRRLLKRPGLTSDQIEAMRKHVILLAQTISEHVWGKKLF